MVSFVFTRYTCNVFAFISTESNSSCREMNHVAGKCAAGFVPLRVHDNPGDVIVPGFGEENSAVLLFSSHSSINQLHFSSTQRYVAPDEAPLWYDNTNSTHSMSTEK